MKRMPATKRVNRVFTAFSAALFIAAVCLAQTAPGKKALTFHGKVQAVDQGAKSLKVNGEKVEGWMDAMTMAYEVDNPAILKKVKSGDQIMATVYEGDMMLHKVMIMPKAKSKE